MKHTKTYPLYRIIRWLVWVFYPKLRVVGQENLPDGPAIVVGNHCQMNGPIASELYFPGKSCIWCAGQMMHLKEVPAYAFEDFWSQKPRWTHGFYRLASYVIAPLSVVVFNNARTIPVYHDARLLTTFRSSIEQLKNGVSMIIFPEHDVPHNHILCDFQDKFIDVARIYYQKTGQILSFVPMYLAPKLKVMCLGKPIPFDPTTPIKEERPRLCRALMDSITDMAVSLPEHTVIPYRNIRKRDYPRNIPASR